MANVIVNSTVGTGAVYRGDGVRLYGLDAEIELKNQAKRDPKYEKELAKWLQEATGMKLEYPEDLIESLRSGIVLCTLINVLLPGTITKINTRPLPLMQIENIGLYLKACWKTGIPSSDLFVTSDLYQRKNVMAVVQNLGSVARSSHNCPDYQGPTFGAKPNIQPVKKWDEIKFSAPLTVADIEKNMPVATPSSCEQCGKMLKACGTCESAREMSERDQKITRLNAQIKEQETKLASLAKNIDEQRKQHEHDEGQLKSTIASQAEQLNSKEKQIQNLSKTIATTANTAANRGSTLVNSNVVSEINGNRNSAKTTPVSVTPASGTTAQPQSNRFSVRMENIPCPKCNFSNSKVSKYCISCGADIKKDLSMITQSSISNPSSTLSVPSAITSPSTSSVNKFRSSSTVVYNSNGTTSISNNHVNQTVPTPSSPEGDLNDKIQILCNTIKEQEDNISKLRLQIRSESDSFEKRIKEQKQVIDNQQFLLGQRDSDLKKLEEENKKIKSVQNSNISGVQKLITPTSSNEPLKNNEIVLNSVNSNQPNRISFSVSGYRSKQVGPGTYQANGTTVNLPALPASTIGNNSSNVSAGNTQQIEQLQAAIKQLEQKLNEEMTKNKVKDSTIKILEDKLSTIQSRPTRKQALANSQVVVGRKRFSTLKPDNLDNRLVETTLSHINDILFSRHIEFHQVSSLNALFKTETGRRRFSQIVQQTMKTLPNLALSESSFEFMLYLLNTILQEMDFSKEHSDFITAKVIFSTSDSLYRINERTNENEYLKNFIKSGLVWKKIEFWEDMFWSMLSKKHRKLHNNNMESIDKDIVKNLLSYLGINMIQFNLSIDEVTKFIKEMANLNQISNSDTRNILDSIKTQQEIQTIVNTQKQTKPDLSSKPKSPKSSKKDKKK